MTAKPQKIIEASFFSMCLKPCIPVRHPSYCIGTNFSNPFRCQMERHSVSAVLQEPGGVQCTVREARRQGNLLH